MDYYRVKTLVTTAYGVATFPVDERGLINQ
jgi:hypothetical protein